MRQATRIVLAADEREQLQRLARGRRVEVRLSERSRIVLHAADGMTNSEIGQAMSISRFKAGRWRDRYAEAGLAGIEKDAPRPGNPSPNRAELTERILEATTQTEPEHATHWSTWTLAEGSGVTDTRVARVWRTHGLPPHRVKTFKVSIDPHFAEKVRDVVGLYLDPPERAIVLSVDEQTQVQALDRTQKDLPIHPGPSLSDKWAERGRTTTSGTGRRRCSPRSTWPRGSSSTSA
jgi:transposase